MEGLIVRQWTEWFIKGEEWKSELVIETSLETDPKAPGFDRIEIEQMIMRAMDGIGDAEHDHIRVIPKGRR